MASSLSSVIIASIRPSTSVRADHLRTTHFHKAWLTSTRPMTLAQYAVPITAERRCEMRWKEKIRGDKVPLRDNRTATLGNCTSEMIQHSLKKSCLLVLYASK